jgi:hypothetical protein
MTTAGLGGVLVAGWRTVARIQGDAELVYETPTLANLVTDERSAHGELTITNRGKQGAVLHKFDARIVSGPAGRVLVTRKESKPPERGWWVSNCLKPGESCVAEVDVELDDPPTGPVTIELDAHELGRSLKVHRVLRLSVPVGTHQPAG